MESGNSETHTYVKFESLLPKKQDNNALDTDAFLYIAASRLFCQSTLYIYSIVSTRDSV